MSIGLEDIERLVGLQLGRKGIRGQDHLRDDLGAESLDIQSLIMTVEDKYRIQIEDAEIEGLGTVADFHALVSTKL